MTSETATWPKNYMSPKPASVSINERFSQELNPRVMALTTRLESSHSTDLLDSEKIRIPTQGVINLGREAWLSREDGSNLEPFIDPMWRKNFFDCSTA